VEVGEEVRVGVDVRFGPVEFKLNEALARHIAMWARASLIRRLTDTNVYTEVRNRFC